jgi:CRP/FNR family transcriptional regulator, cyclic AMP receptor protein
VAAVDEGQGVNMAGEYWFLKRCRLLERLPVAELQRLETCCRSRQFPAGTSIYLPEDHADAVLLLVAGRIKLCHVTPDGKESILALIEPGELFGELCLIGETRRDESAIAAVASTVVLIPRAALEALMNTYTELTLGVTRLLGLRRLRIERRLKHLLFRSNRDRLIHLLLELAESHGTRAGSTVEIRLKLSHQDLASIIGSSRETVTNTLGELQLQRLVKLGRQRVSLLDIDRLIAAANSSDGTTNNR